MKKLVFLILFISSMVLLYSQTSSVVKEGSLVKAKVMNANVPIPKDVDNSQVTTLSNPEYPETPQIPETPKDGTRAARTASVSGAWNSTTTWGGLSVPVAGDAVTINSGITVTVTAPAACTSITFAAINANSAITINGTNTLTVSGLVSMPRPAAGFTGTINVNAGSMSIGTTLTMSATVTSRNDVFNVTTGTLTVTGNITCGTTGCIFNISSTGTMNFGGTFSNTPTLTTVTGSTVNYTGAAAQTILAKTYSGNLGLSGAGTKTIASTTSVTVLGNFTNSSTLSVTEGTSTTSTWFSVAGNFTNSGTFTEAGPDYSRFVLNGTTGNKTLTNTGTITSGLCEFGVANSSGVTISSNSNQIVTTRPNLFSGVVTNSNKLTIGTGAALWFYIQRGVSASTSPAGSFDSSPTFNIGSGGLILFYDNGSVAYNTGYEVPSSLTVDALYIFDAADVSLISDLTINYELDFYGGTGTPTLRIGANTLTLGGGITYTVAGAFYGSTSSNLVIDGSTTLNAVTNGLNNLTINANTTLGGAVTVNGTLTLTSGLMTNGANLTMATGTTISRSAGMLMAAPTFAGTVNLIYTGSSPITAGKELPTGSSVINNLTTNTGGFTQYAYTSNTANILTDNFPNITNWTGNKGSAAGQYQTIASVNAGGTTPEVEFIGSGSHSTSSTTYYIYSAAVNTTGKIAVNLSFKMMSTGNYTQNFPTYLKLQSATSTSGPWHDIMSADYAAYAAQTVSIPYNQTDVGGSVYFQFAYVGDYYATDYWYFDNFVVDGITNTPAVSNITINGTLNLTGDYTIGSGNTLTMANNATINRSNGTLSAAPSFGTNVNLIYSGSNAITTGVENPGTGINNLTINNSSVSGVTLGKATTVTTLTFTNGNLNFGGFILTLANKDFGLTGSNSISALNVTLDAVTVHTYDGSQGLAHTWQTNGTISGAVDIIFSYPASLSTSSVMKVYNRNHVVGESSWNYLSTLSTVNHTTYYSVTLTGVTTLNGSKKGDLDWTLSEANQDLPVELSSFTAALSQQNFVTLSWVTQSETNEIGFNIFRNFDDALSTAIQVNANMISATNTSNEHTYYFRDMIVTDDNEYYYWLQDVSTNGSATFHGPILVELGNYGQITPPPNIPLVTGVKSIFPNPFTSDITINYCVAQKGMVYINVYNSKGQRVRSLMTDEKDANTYRINWDGKDMSGHNCASGIYVIEMISGNIRSSIKTIRMK